MTNNTLFQKPLTQKQLKEFGDSLKKSQVPFQDQLDNQEQKANKKRSLFKVLKK